MNKPSKSSRSNRNRLMIFGFKKHYVATPSIIVEGIQYQTTDVENALQASIDAAAATAAAAAAFHKAVAAEGAANAKGDALYRGSKAVLVNQYKTSLETLADFGITLQPAQTPDAMTVANAVVKRNATRAARHTMGSRQRSHIHGAVPSTGAPPAGAPGTSASATPVPSAIAKPTATPS